MMPALQDDDFFDFSEQIFGEPVKEKREETPALNSSNEIKTSYILVNALLSLLIQKGIIHHHEVNSLVAELYDEYVKKKRGE